MSRASICPTCKRQAKPHPENGTFPFCSPRCKLADLSNWFDERYSVPAEDAQSFDGEEGDQRVLN